MDPRSQSIDDRLNNVNAQQDAFRQAFHDSLIKGETLIAPLKGNYQIEASIDELTISTSGFPVITFRTVEDASKLADALFLWAMSRAGFEYDQMVENKQHLKIVKGD